MLGRKYGEIPTPSFYNGVSEDLKDFEKPIRVESLTYLLLLRPTTKFNYFDWIDAHDWFQPGIRQKYLWARLVINYLRECLKVKIFQ